MSINRDRFYKDICMQIEGITSSYPYITANLANTAAILWDTLECVSWVGFYMIEDDALIVGPFQGKVACVKIPKGRGVCGTAWAEDKTQLVPNVHEFPGHIACDSASKSEIVVPIHKNGEVVGVLDIDSPEFNTFSEDDAKGLEEVVEVIEKFL